MSNSLQTEQTKEPPNQKAPTIPPPPEKPKEVIVSEVQIYDNFINFVLFYLKIFGTFCFRLLHRLAPSD